MKTEQFKRCAETLAQEYERSKAKHPDFDSVDLAWRAIQREFSEVVNESLRDTIKPEALATEMLHLANVALQGYMFLMEKDVAETEFGKSKLVFMSTKKHEESWVEGELGEAWKENSSGKWIMIDDTMKMEKEDKTMTKKDWYSGVIEATQAIRDGKQIQINWHEDPKCWKDYEPIQDGERLVFDVRAWYRAKPEPKLRALTPQEWLEALMAGKKIENMISFSLVGNKIEGLGGMWIKIGADIKIYTSHEMINKTFSDGSPCGVEVIE